MVTLLPDASFHGFLNEELGVPGSSGGLGLHVIGIGVEESFRDRIDVTVAIATVVVVQSEGCRAVVDRGGREDVRVRTAFTGHPLHFVGDGHEVSRSQPQRNAEGSKGWNHKADVRDEPPHKRLDRKGNPPQQNTPADHDGHDKQRPPDGGVVVSVDGELEPEAIPVHEDDGGSCGEHDEELRLSPLVGPSDLLTEILQLVLVDLALILIELLALFPRELLEVPAGCGCVTPLGSLLRHEQRTAEDEDAEFQHQETVPVPVGQEGEQCHAANHEVVRSCTPPAGPEFGATLQPPPVNSASGDHRGCDDDNGQGHVNSPFRSRVAIMPQRIPTQCKCTVIT